MSPNLYVRLWVMMFIQYFFWGAWYVSAYPYLNNKIGFDALDLANTYSMAPLAAMISPFFIGMIADRFFATQKVLGVLHLLGGALLFAAGDYTLGDKSFLFTFEAGENPTAWMFNGLLLAHFLCFMPTLGLSNTLCFHKMDNPEQQFPWIRVMGTIGWIAAGFVISRLAINGLTIDDSDATKETAVWMFKLGALSGIGLGLYCFTLPNTPPASAGKKITARDILCLDALQLMANRSFAIFIVCSCIICIPLAFYFQLATSCLGDMKIEKYTEKMSYGQMSEIFFMLLMPLLFARLGVKKMILIGMLAWVARYGLFAIGAADPAHPVVGMLMAGIILHGICYDFFFVTGQIYVDKAAPKEIRGAAQGFLVLVTLGAGMYIGAWAAGFIKERYTTDVTDWQTIWMVPAAMAAGVFVLFGLLFRDPPKEDTEQQDDPGGANEAGSEDKAAQAPMPIEGEESE
ncbi:MAG: nucleoside permease [Planctomycetota bacterium]|nr:nucleoside permease [Planctomycetota bacterium]